MESEPPSKDTGKVEARRKKSRAHCTACRYHGVKTPWLGHKKVCPYRGCRCDNCRLNEDRRCASLLLRNLKEADGPSIDEHAGNRRQMRKHKNKIGEARERMEKLSKRPPTTISITIPDRHQQFSSSTDSCSSPDASLRTLDLEGALSVGRSRLTLDNMSESSTSLSSPPAAAGSISSPFQPAERQLGFLNSLSATYGAQFTPQMMMRGGMSHLQSPTSNQLFHGVSSGTKAVAPALYSAYNAVSRELGTPIYTPPPCYPAHSTGFGTASTGTHNARPTSTWPAYNSPYGTGTYAENQKPALTGRLPPVFFGRGSAQRRQELETVYFLPLCDARRQAGMVELVLNLGSHLIPIEAAEYLKGKFTQK